jgi:hypothetical protein
MAFSFGYTAKTKAAAKKEFTARNKASGENVPAEVVKAAEAMIDALPDAPKGHVINVSTTGHFPSEEFGGQCNISFNIQHVIA